MMPKSAANSQSIRQLQKIAQVLEKQASVASAAVGAAGKATEEAGKRAVSRLPWGADARKQLAPILAFGAAAAGVGTLLGLGEEGIRYGVGRAAESAYASRQPKRYAAMIKTDPSLKDHPRTRQMFAVLDRVAPFVASEPVLAASAVRSMIEQPTYGSDPRGLPLVGMQNVKQLLDVQKGRQETRFPSITRSKSNTHGVPKIDAGIAFQGSDAVTGASSP